MSIPATFRVTTTTVVLTGDPDDATTFRARDLLGPCAVPDDAAEQLNAARDDWYANNAPPCA